MGDILIFARIDPKIFPLDATLSRCSMHICASIKNRKNWDTIGHVLFLKSILSVLLRRIGTN